jgi:hypothetical protein
VPADPADPTGTPAAATTGASSFAMYFAKYDRI